MVTDQKIIIRLKIGVEFMCKLTFIRPNECNCKVKTNE